MFHLPPWESSSACSLVAITKQNREQMGWGAKCVNLNHWSWLWSRRCRESVPWEQTLAGSRWWGFHLHGTMVTCGTGRWGFQGRVLGFCVFPPPLKSNTTEKQLRVGPPGTGPAGHEAADVWMEPPVTDLSCRKLVSFWISVLTPKPSYFRRREINLQKQLCLFFKTKTSFQLEVRRLLF